MPKNFQGNFLLLMGTIALLSCNEKKKGMNSAQDIQPPVAEKIPKELTIHGDKRIDNYYWLNDPENPKVIDYLKAENAYLDTIMAPEKKLRSKLFEEMKARIKETDQSVPYLKNGYYYYSRYEAGKEYPIFCRKKGSLEAAEQVILNVNELAAGHAYCHVAGINVSPDAKLLAYAIDTVSRRRYTIKVKNLETNQLLPDNIPDATPASAWAADNKTLFYTKKDTVTLRSCKVLRHQLGDSNDKEIYNETDETYDVSVRKTKSGQYIVIESESTLSSESRIVDANKPTEAFRIFQPRTKDMLYSIEHRDDKFYIVTNWDALNFRLMQTPLAQTSRQNWKELIPNRSDVLLQGMEIFKDFMVLAERKDGLTRLRVIDEKKHQEKFIPFSETTYTVSIGTNREMDSKELRYNYTSLITPSSVYDYNMETGNSELKRQEEVLGGYDPKDYATERLFATASDGTKIPISIVYKKTFEKNGKNPLLLYGYGSYGYSMDVEFDSDLVSLLDRGFAYAIAHIRGGQEMGRQWYEDGKLFKKKNTFTDFIACAEYLVQQHYTDTSHLYAMGGSAGGLLMGAVVNMKPNLFHGVIAQVPFVDVVTTMLDESIPLTTGEFDEWGNPKNKDSYDYMKSYSPYDNVQRVNYPNMLVTTGLHDSQVQYYEPAKWVAKLREMKTDHNLLLLHTNMEAGHGGASGRYKALEEVALEYSFLLKLEGK
ncbi:oligopeptidase B [Chitinophaga terrae (ex Kim and Jung 2007)]|uniref:S9 family peptidase n=1 Tax=Chitinophaga terrae (ex Kim and Jung 2007) TaxID=408074 RepID=UPI00278470FD|nr:S9 family peptidase [Chitinophaga terrae (ex Kim and Jung 2007)]MDQ0108543.1 oligopeptidase B [Chitinophaga terrae (ex Kim and Jung 2007)]